MYRKYNNILNFLIEQNLYCKILNLSKPFIDWVTPSFICRMIMITMQTGRLNFIQLFGFICVKCGTRWVALYNRLNQPPTIPQYNTCCSLTWVNFFFRRRRSGHVSKNKCLVKAEFGISKTSKYVHGWPNYIFLFFVSPSSCLNESNIILHRTPRAIHVFVCSVLSV